MDEIRSLEFFIRRLYAKGKLSIRDAYQRAAIDQAEAMDDPDINCLEAELSSPIALAVHHLQEEKKTRRVEAGVTFPPGPILVPVELSSEQEKVLAEWRSDGGGDWACGFDEGEYLILDTIKWKFGPGWRNLYPEIPCC